MAILAPTTVERRVFQLFGSLLAYPEAGLAEAARECQALVATRDEEAGALLGEFLAVVEATPLGRLQEIYTGTFDLDPSCYPYVGYHLFGESYKRSVFLIGLKERYRARGFTVEKELPDHLAVLLCFLATTDDQELAEELIRDALLPTLERMVAPGEDKDDADQSERRLGLKVYQRVLQALKRIADLRLQI